MILFFYYFNTLGINTFILYSLDYFVAKTLFKAPKLQFCLIFGVKPGSKVVFRTNTDMPSILRAWFVPAARHNLANF